MTWRSPVEEVRPRRANGHVTSSLNPGAQAGGAKQTRSAQGLPGRSPVVNPTLASCDRSRAYRIVPPESASSGLS